MSYIYDNPNPYGKKVGDCVIRALSRALGMSWDEVAIDLSMMELALKDMPNADAVWGEYLDLNGFRKGILPHPCPNCINVRQFCEMFPRGTFVVATGFHVIAVIDGNYYDREDTGDETLIYFWEKER